MAQKFRPPPPTPLQTCKCSNAIYGTIGARIAFEIIAILKILSKMSLI